MTKQPVSHQDLTSRATILQHTADVVRMSSLLTKHILKEKEQMHLPYLAALQELLLRVRDHDASKLGEGEWDIFRVSTQELPNLTLGSPEYAAALVEMKDALAHHYEHNSHHPEYFPGGIGDMLPDNEVSAVFIEMCIDVYVVNRLVYSLEDMVDMQVNLYNPSPDVTMLLRALIELLYQLDVADMEAALTKMGQLGVTGKL